MVLLIPSFYKCGLVFERGRGGWKVPPPFHPSHSPSTLGCATVCLFQETSASLSVDTRPHAGHLGSTAPIVVTSDPAPAPTVVRGSGRLLSVRRIVSPFIILLTPGRSLYSLLCPVGPTNGTSGHPDCPYTQGEGGSQGHSSCGTTSVAT